MAEAEDELRVLAEAAKLPLAEQVAHKNWRVRLQAFDSIKAACEGAAGPEDPALDGLGALVRHVGAVRSGCS